MKLYSKNCNHCGVFYKGLGKKYCSYKCSHVSSERRNLLSKKLLGKKMPKEAVLKSSANRTGAKRTEESRQKMRIAQLGKKHSEQTRRKMSDAHKGDKAYQWRGGLTHKNTRIRHSLEYRLWRESVFKRDDWTCQICLIRGGILNADHIMAFSVYPELRFDINNGRTLCVSCHKKTINYGTKALRQRELS